MPDLRQLRAFVAVAEELNFTRAAERLHLGQQAVSKSVRLLESELGVELLERTTREVGLTAAGAELLDSGREVLRAADTAFARVQEVGGGLSGSIDIGVSPAVGPGALQEVIEALRQDAPDLTLSVRDVRPGEVRQVLLDRGVDLVLMRTVRASTGLESAPLPPTPAVLALPVDHRLSADQSVALAELDGERLLTWNPPGSTYTDLLLSRIAAGGATVEPIESRVMGTQDLSELGERDAVAVVPRGWPSTDGVVLVELRDEITLPLVALWPAGSRSLLVERIRQRIAAASA